jgi:TolB-like protein
MRTNAQSNLKDAKEDLIEKFIEEVKNQAKERSIESIAVWRIEAEEAQSVDTKALVDRLNIRLMEEGLLPEQMIDFSEIGDKTSLSRIKNICGISYFLQGTKTVREGNNIRVQFEMLDMNTYRTIWQREILGIEEEIPQKEIAKVIEENVQGSFD